MDGVLQTLFGARVIPPVAVAEGNRNVGLLDVAEHLLVELLAQPGKRRHHRFGVGVLGFEKGVDFGILLVAQPCVVVDQGECHGRRFQCGVSGQQEAQAAGSIHHFFSLGEGPAGAPEQSFQDRVL